LHALIIACREAGSEFLLEQWRMRPGSVTTDVLTRIHARACLVASEGHVLLRSGYASGANARWRSLHELTVVAFLIAEYGDDLAERFIRYQAVSAWRMASSEREHAKLLGIRGPSEADVRELHEEVDRLVARFGPRYAEEYGWAESVLGSRAPTFRNIEAAVDLGHLRPFYKLASGPIHAGAAGLLEDLGAEASRGQVLLSGASNTGLRIPGQGLAIALNQCTTALLMSDVTMERILTMFSLLAFADRCVSAFGLADDEADRLTRIAHGYRTRQVVYACRRASRVRWHGPHVGPDRRRRRRSSRRLSGR
jgi:hypothetical protein